jgi:hypothetical protein
MTDKIDWSQFEVKENVSPQIDWSQYDQNTNEQQSFSEDNEGLPIPETTGLSGIGSDLLSAALSAKDFAVDVPNKLEKLGGNILENPVSGRARPIGQLTAEAGNIGKEIINAPYNLNQYLARKHLLPEILGKIGGKIIPHISEDMGIERSLGLEADKEKGDDLIRALPNIVATTLGAKSLTGQVKRGLKSPDLKESIRATQNKVNEATSETGKIFDTVEQAVEERGISKVKIDKNILKQAETFLANTPANKALIQRAKTGDYKALRELQADLRVKGEKALSSALAAENKMGEEILSTRDQVNQSIQKHLDNTGNKDLAKSLNKARENYRDIQDVYFSTPALAKVFGRSQKVPKNPLTLLSEESTEMNKFMSAHPEVKDALSKALKHKGRMKNLSRIGQVTGIGTSMEIARELLARK